MKKFYLLLIAAFIACTATAKVDYSLKRSNQKKQAPISMASTIDKPVVMADQAAPDDMPLQLKAQPVEGETFYYRPRGSFYVGYNPLESRIYYSPYLYLPNFRDVTFRGTQVADWSYQKWDRTVSGRPWIAVEGQQYLTLNFVTETDSVPYIMGPGSEYFLFGHDNTNTENVPMTLYSHNDLATRLASNTNGYEGWFASPKYWASRDRDLAYTSITRYLTGALDSDAGTTAFWFGKNYSGWNACAIYCEKPQNPYVIRGAAIRYAFYMSTEPVELTMRIYKAGTHEPREMSFGELIAEGKATLPASPGEETSGGLYFTFTEVDPEWGLTAEVTPEIDDEIYVVLSGYDNAAIGRLGIPLCADIWDEGIGETGYNIQLDADGNIGMARSLNAMFNGFKGYSAPGIFLDVTYPFIINNYNNDPSVRKYDAAGNLTYDGTDNLYYGSQFSAYTTESSDMWEIKQANGSELPDWLTITAEDQFDETTNEFSGEVISTIEVAPLPAGVEGRKAVVRFKILGDYHDLTIIQGEEPVDVYNEFYLVGTFNGWNQTEEGGRIAFTATDEEGIYEATGELEAGAEFKVITPDGEGWKWFGGVDENYVGYFLINNDLINVPLTMVDGANFRLENGGKFTFRVNANDLTLTLIPKNAIAGDVDGDGSVTSADITALYNWLLDNDDSAIVNGDQDGDGSITSGDVTIVYNILLEN